jgi:hypothetical protein
MKILRFLGNAVALIVMAAVAVFLLLVIFAPAANAAGTVAQLSWTHPTMRIDDTPLALSEIRETLIEWRRTAGGPIVGTLRVAAPANTASAPGLVCGDFVFSAATIANNGDSSAPTAPVAYTTEIRCVPKSPTGLGAR